MLVTCLWHEGMLLLVIIYFGMISYIMDVQIFIYFQFLGSQFIFSLISCLWSYLSHNKFLQTSLFSLISTVMQYKSSKFIIESPSFFNYFDTFYRNNTGAPWITGTIVTTLFHNFHSFCIILLNLQSI